MEKQWKISSYVSGDEHQIKDLQKLIYGDELEPEKESSGFWKWEFINNPYEKAFINTAKVDKKIVGHYAVIPLEYKLLDDIVKAGLVVDIMTHPDYRKQGMFVSLGRSSMDWMKNNGFAFSTGYPYKDNVMPGHKKVGWEEVFDLNVYVIPIDTKNISVTLSKNKIKQKMLNLGLKTYITFRKYKCSSKDKNIKITKLERFPKNIEKFFDKVNDDFSFIQNRTFEFLKWRYDDTPDRKYGKYFLYDKEMLSGYVVVRKMKIFNLSTLFIVDMLGITNFHYELLLDHIYNLYSRSNIDLISFAVSPNTKIISILKKKRFLKSGSKFHLISYDCGQNLQLIRDNSQNSYITSHDFDVM